MLRIAIAEDDLSYQSTLKTYLEQFQQETGIQVEATIFQDGIALAERYRPIYDLILLDIEMPLLDGMATARRIREVDPYVLLMFITNMNQYAIEGYKVDALDYVLKPISYFAFQAKLKKAAAIMEHRANSYLVLHVGGTMTRVSAAEIYYVEVLNHKLSFYTEGGDFQVSSSLRSIERQLEGQHFVRCNKCYLVNLRHIVHVNSNSVILSNGTELPLSRLRKKDFLLAVTDYYGEGGK